MADASINDVDAGVVDLLDELSAMNADKFRELIPDPHTRALLSLMVFLEGYGNYEAASVLANEKYTPRYFQEHWMGVFLDIDASQIAEIIREGDF